MNVNFLSAWQNDSEFRKNTGSDFVVTRGNEKEKGCSAAARAAAKWNITDGVAIGAPNGGIELPPICIDQFSEKALGSYRRKRKLEKNLLVAALMLLPVFACIKGSAQSVIAPAVLFMITLALKTLDDLLYLSNKENLAQRGRFVFWIIRNVQIRRIFLAVIFFGAFLYLCQRCLEMYFGGREEFLEANEFIYSKVAAGEYWRIITAPWIHASFIHLANNVVLTAVAFPFLYLCLRLRAITYFLCGSVIGQIAQWLIHPIGDVLVGMSGGAFALLGAGAGVSLRFRKSLPAGLYWTVVYVGVFTLLGAHLINPQSAGVSHLTGFCMGLLGELYSQRRVSLGTGDRRP